MSSRAGSRSIEDLLTHAEWLRGLALHLVGDAAGAEDLVQETWVAALRRPPDADRPARPWLAGVIRRLASRRARTLGRALHREHAVARPEATPSTAELLAQVDTERRLAEEVTRLAEPFREAVLLRYRQGLEPRDIAARLGIPASTVRGRLQEGLRRLRERLDAAYPDRGAWCTALLGLQRRPAPPLAPTAGPAGGLAAVSLSLKLVAAAGIAGVAALAWFAASDGEDPRVASSPAIAGAPVVAPVVPGGDAAALASGPLPSSRAAVEPAPVAAGNAGSPRHEQRVLVRAEDGSPLPGAEVVLSAPTGGRLDQGRTDEEGLARFQVDTSDTGWTHAWLGVRLAGRLPHVRGVALALDEHVVVLPRGAEVAGVVLLDGLPPRAPVDLVLASDHPIPVEREAPPGVLRDVGGRDARITTGPDGTFRFDGLARDWSGTLRLARDDEGLHLDAPRTGSSWTSPSLRRSRGGWSSATG